MSENTSNITDLASFNIHSRLLSTDEGQAAYVRPTCRIDQFDHNLCDENSADDVAPLLFGGVSVGQTICLYIPVVSDSSIFYYSVSKSPTSIFG